MIGQHLEPLLVRPAIYPAEIHERWMLTHLAYYTANPLPERTVESFKRAWGMDTIWRFPRSDSGRPGYVVAVWDNTTPKRICIAIEGATSWGQILDLAGITTTGINPYGVGRVLTLFISRAQEFRVHMNDNGVTALITANNSKKVIFTGHSLGSAIAELQTAAFAGTYDHNSYFCTKFGGPRVGDRTYVNGRPLITQRTSWYADNDPIQLIPRGGVRRAQDISPLGLNGGFLAADGNGRGINRYGANYQPYENESLQTTISLLSRVNAESVPGNPWYWHHRNAYRYVFSLEAARVGLAEYTAYRTLYCEMPDENQWGANLSRDGNYTPEMLSLTETPPDDVATGYVAPPSESRLHSTAGATMPRVETTNGNGGVNRGAYSPLPYHRVHRVRN